jgi:general secretion pathway protein E
MATPVASVPAFTGTDAPTKFPKRTLRIEEILTLLVADGLVTSADADSLARAKVRRTEHPLETIAEKNWHTATGPRMPLTLDWLVEWLAGKLGVPYTHIDPLKIDLTAVTQTMTNAYAERYRILPIEVTRTTLTVATSEPFEREWADELEKILKLDVRLVFANPKDIRRLPRRVLQPRALDEEGAGDLEGRGLDRARLRAARSRWASRASSTPTTATSSTSSTGSGSTPFDQRASTSTSSPRRDAGQVRFRIDGVLHQVYAIPTPVLVAMTSRIKLLATHGDRRRNGVRRTGGSRR